MSERILLLVALAATVAIGLYALRRHSPLSAPSLSLVATLLAGGFYPFLTLFVEARSWRNLARLGEDTLRATQLDYLGFALGLLAAIWLAWGAGWLARAPVASEDPGTRSRDAIIAWGLVLSGACLYWSYVERVGLGVLMNRDDYAEKYLRSQGLGPLAFGLPMMSAGVLWGEGSALSGAHKWPLRALALALAVWTLAFLSVRTNLVVLVIGFAAIHCRRRGFQLARVRPLLVVALVLCWAGLEAFSQFRGAYKGDIGQALRLMDRAQGERLELLAGGSELSHPFITAMEVRCDDEGGALLGASYLRAFECFLPAALDPDRPSTLSQAFAREHYASLAARGGGTAFSLVAEAWLNFGGFAGPWLVGLVFGWLCLWIERRAACRPEGLLARLLPFLLLQLVIEHRSESATLLKYALSIGLPVLALWALAELAGLALAPRRSPRGPWIVPKAPTAGAARGRS